MARLSRRSQPVEVDTAAVLVGMKQPLFASHSRNSSFTCKTGLICGCFALACAVLGFTLAAAFYEHHIYKHGSQAHQIGRRGRIATVQVCLYLSRVIVHRCHHRIRLVTHNVLPKLHTNACTSVHKWPAHVSNGVFAVCL